MVLVDLVVDKNLLDLKFEGYKLTLDSVPILKQPVPSGVVQYKPDGKEYSYLQLHMSSQFNHLHYDPWAPSCASFISQKKFINWSTLTQGITLDSPKIVWKFPCDVHDAKANAAIVYPSSEWAIVCDGIGIVYLLYTPSRTAGEPWIQCHSYELPNCKSSCYLLYGTHRTLAGRMQIDCALAHFCEVSENEKNNKMKCHLEWLSFNCGQDFNVWSLKRTRRLAGTSPLLYVALETACDALYVVSEKEYEFVYDSEMPLTARVEKEKSEESVLYTYSQSKEDIIVDIDLPSQDLKESDFQVQFEPAHLEVKWQNKTVLDGNLSNVIDSESCTWSLTVSGLKLTLNKLELGLMWPELIVGDKNGKEEIDPALCEEIHTRLAHLTSEKEATEEGMGVPFNMDELEECDSCSAVVSFSRIDGNSHEETHKIHLGGHQWLFTCQRTPKCLPSICLRHNVDGFIWQLTNPSSDGELECFKIKHIATFSALGYVQASKENKRFALCSSSYSYAVITDCNRHVYVYCQPESLSSALELRNRKTGQSVSHVAKQHVINLENCNEILGLQISEDGIFILSSNMLYVIKKQA